MRLPVRPKIHDLDILPKIFLDPGVRILPQLLLDLHADVFQRRNSLFGIDLDLLVGLFDLLVHDCLVESPLQPDLVHRVLFAGVLRISGQGHDVRIELRGRQNGSALRPVRIFDCYPNALKVIRSLINTLVGTEFTGQPLYGYITAHPMVAASANKGGYFNSERTYMLSRLSNLWTSLRTGLWFVPTLMALGAIALAATALNLDAGLAEETAEKYWLHSGGPEDARNLLSTVFSSMVTMATLVISITMVVLTLAASQLGPRLVRNFMGDLRTQLVFGLFLMTIIYCLLVLRTINGELDTSAVPHVAVTIATTLALINLFALMFFIHNLARSIVSDTVIRRVDGDLRSSITRLLPAENESQSLVERPMTESVLAADFDERASSFLLSGEGYVQTIEYQQLLETACRHNTVVRLDFRAGDFVIRGSHKVDVYPGHLIGPDLMTEIEDAILIGEDRTPVQDLEFSIRHLVEVAVRALSPGINDPFTATAVIDRLGAALGELMQRELQPVVFRDETGVVRVVGRASSFRSFVNVAFNQIRQAGANHPAVIIQMLNTIAQLGVKVRLSSQRDALLDHAASIAEAGRRGASETADIADIEQSYQAAQRALKLKGNRLERLGRQKGTTS